MFLFVARTNCIFLLQVLLFHFLVPDILLSGKKLEFHTKVCVLKLPCSKSAESPQAVQ